MRIGRSMCRRPQYTGLIYIEGTRFDSFLSSLVHRVFFLIIQKFFQIIEIFTDHKKQQKTSLAKIDFFENISKIANAVFVKSSKTPLLYVENQLFKLR